MRAASTARVAAGVTAALALSTTCVAGAAPKCIGACGTPPPRPGQVVSSSFPHRVLPVASAAAEQPDGRIVVAGTVWVTSQYGTDSQTARVVGRFTGGGNPDAAFARNGAATLFSASGRVSGDGVAVQPDGKILVAGRDGPVPIVERFGSDGEPDPTFGTAGRVRGARSADDTLPITLGLRTLADGTIVVVRNARQPTLTPDAAPGGVSIERLAADGTLLWSASHSAPEWRLHEASGYAAWAKAAIEPDGSVVLAGSVADPEPFLHDCPCEIHSIFIVRRYAADGSVDTSFGQSGRAMTKIETDAYASDAAVGTDGSIVVAGAVGSAGGSFGAARYRADGSLDPSFGAGGRFALPVSDNGGAERVALTADGGLFLAGRPGLTILRLDRNGGLVGTFGSGGRARANSGGSVAAILPDGDGGVRVVTSNFALVRVTAQGDADPSFGGTPIPVGLTPRGARALARPRDREAVVAGWIGTDPGRTAVHVVRGPFGVPGNSFGTNGEVTLRLGDRSEATAVAVDGHGRVIAAGVSQTGDGSPRWFAARLLGDGSLDPAFGGAGVARPLAAAADSELAGAATLPDGRVLLVGHATGSVLLVRLAVDGSLDPSFGAGGRVVLPLDRSAGLALAENGSVVVGGSLDGRLAAVALDADGRPSAPMTSPVSARAAGVAVQHDGAVVVAGTSTDGAVVARWRGTGTLDTGFGDGGVVVRPGFDAAGVAVQRDGRIVVAANARTDKDKGLAVLRLLYSGRPDASFGTDGVAVATPGATAAAVASAPGGIDVAGTAPAPGGSDLALAALYDEPLVAPVVGVNVTSVTPRGAIRGVAPGTQPAVSPDGKLLAYIGDDAGAPSVFVAGARGGRPHRIVTSPRPDGSVLMRAAPLWSRDGRFLALSIRDETGAPGIAIVRADGGEVRTITRAWSPTWGPRDRLAYADDATRQIVVLDVASGERRLLGPGSRASWSPRGDLLVVDSWLVRPDGTRVAGLPRTLRDVSWKPDGKELLGIEGRRLLAVDLRGRRRRRLALVAAAARSPVWSPDGRWIAFIDRRNGNRLTILDERTRRRVVAWAAPSLSFDGAAPSWGRSEVYVAVAGGIGARMRACCSRRSSAATPNPAG